MLQRVRLDLGARQVGRPTAQPGEQPGALPRVRGEQGRRLAAPLEEVEPTGVEEHRYVRGQRGPRHGPLLLSTLVRVVGVEPGPDAPGLDPPFARDGLGDRRPHEVGRCRRPDVPDHARAGRDRCSHAEHRCARVALTTGDDAQDTAGVLVVLRRRHRPERRHVIGGQAHERWRGALEVETDVEDGEDPAGGLGRRHEVHRLGRAEGHRLVGEDRVRHDRPAVEGLTARGVDGDDPRVVADRLDPRPGEGGQPGPPADPRDAVEDQLGP